VMRAPAAHRAYFSDLGGSVKYALRLAERSLRVAVLCRSIEKPFLDAAASILYSARSLIRVGARSVPP
jgi:hypothetical protein